MISTLDDQLGEILKPLGEGDAAAGLMQVDGDFQKPHNQLDMHYLEAVAHEDRAAACRMSGSSDEQHRETDLVASSRDHWQQVLRFGIELLGNHYKDLGALARVIQAWVRIEGAAGLAVGYRAAAGVLDRFGDALFARWQGSVADEFKPLASLDRVLLVPIRRLPVTQAGTPFWSAHRLVSIQHQLERHAGEVEEQRNKRFERTRVTPSDLEAFSEAVASTPVEFYVEAVAELEAALTALDHFQQVAAEVVARLRELYEKQFPGHPLVLQPPPIQCVAAALQEVLQMIRELAGDKLAPPESEEADDSVAEACQGESGNMGSESSGGGRLGGGPLRTREQAFHQLELIAQFFERSEPHSLLPAQLRRVVRQGRLSVQALFEEVIEDPAAREQMFRLVGIRSGQDSSDSP